MTYATTSDDTKLYIKTWGSGRPVVLIHGWPLNADSWDDIALALAGAGFKTIAYDRRGFGRSDQPWTGYDYDTLADDLAAVMDKCGAHDATLVGFSMGGGEVARYLSKHGATKVRSAVLVAAVTPFMLKREDNPAGVDQSVFDDMKDKMHEDRDGFMQGFAKQFYGAGIISHPVSQGVLDHFFGMAMMGGVWPTMACANAFATTDFRGDMAAFTVPTLILHGTNDAAVPIDSSGREAARLIPGARMIEYDGGPHGLLVTHKTEVTRDLLDFLRLEDGAGKSTSGSQSAMTGLNPSNTANADHDPLFIAPGLQPTMR